jgi:hypothetical protein
VPSKEKQDPDLMNTLLRLFPRKETKEGSIIIKMYLKKNTPGIVELDFLC